MTTTTTTTMGRCYRGAQQPPPAAAVTVEDKSEEMRGALRSLTLQEDAKTSTPPWQRPAFRSAAVLSSEESDELGSFGYEDDLDASTPMKKWQKRGRRRRRIDMALMPYAKRVSAVRPAAGAAPSAPASMGLGERQRRMAQSARRLAHLHVQSALRHWRATAELVAAQQSEHEARATAAEESVAKEAGALPMAALPVSARALCERVRQQARRKLREERKRLLLARQLAREEARKHAAAAAQAAAAAAAAGVIPSTEAFEQQQQQRVQAAMDAWRAPPQEQLTVAMEEQGPAAVMGIDEEELRLRFQEAAAQVERAQLRVVLRAWHSSALAAAAAAKADEAANPKKEKQQAFIVQGLTMLTLNTQRRALRVWRANIAIALMMGPPVEQRRAKATRPPGATGAGELAGEKEATGQAGMTVWVTGAYGWLREEVARVVARPRATADADEYLEVM